MKWLTRKSRHPEQSTSGDTTASQELSQQIDAIDKQLNQLRRHPPSRDVVFLQQAALRLASIRCDLEDLSRGCISFQSTETWRTVYETVLSTCQTKRYLSVALIQTDGYWRTAPGEVSLQLNYDLVERGFHVHRLFLIDDFFWPPGGLLPHQELLDWIGAQYVRGIEIGLVRLGDLEKEPQLVCDMGIYGQRAVGYQTVDVEGTTASFELRFDAVSLRVAQQRWDQLRLYEVALETLLDRPH